MDEFSRMTKVINKCFNPFEQNLTSGQRFLGHVLIFGLGNTSSRAAILAHVL